MNPITDVIDALLKHFDPVDNDPTAIDCGNGLIWNFFLTPDAEINAICPGIGESITGYPEEVVAAFLEGL